MRESGNRSGLLMDSSKDAGVLVARRPAHAGCHPGSGKDGFRQLRPLSREPSSRDRFPTPAGDPCCGRMVGSFLPPYLGSNSDKPVPGAGPCFFSAAQHAGNQAALQAPQSVRSCGPRKLQEDAGIAVFHSVGTINM